jgi:hypothetical protein
MSEYSLDLREQIVESVKKGVPKAQTARRFGVDPPHSSATTASNSKSAELSNPGRLQAEPRSWTRRPPSYY